MFYCKGEIGFSYSFLLLMVSCWTQKKVCQLDSHEFQQIIVDLVGCQQERIVPLVAVNSPRTGIRDTIYQNSRFLRGEQHVAGDPDYKCRLLYLR